MIWSREKGNFCFDFGLILKHTSSRSMFSLSVVPVSPSLAFSNLKGDNLLADQYQFFWAPNPDQYYITYLSAMSYYLP